ncbi:hypothetical protein BDZ94DRAFT_1205430 [Collybia nuda]|uniref:Protein kinase domain-containing protein n=1 Tax=Collybia nuda TaxID=64659 RepID=A0A9P5XRX5_9AGAR|nr:hypothetical protein BDZ94DRAFT_1205430 [Collybia nuda]
MTALPSSTLLTPDIEPNTQWKSELSSRIYEFVELMLLDVETGVEAKLKRDLIGVDKQEHLTAEYTNAVGDIQKLAVEAFQEELERERRECRRKVNEALLPQWDEAFKQRQQEIMDTIENGEEDYSESDSDSDTTEPGILLPETSIPSGVSTPLSNDDKFPGSIPNTHSYNPAAYIPTTLYPQYEADIEPNVQWKAVLRMSVEDSLQPLVDNARGNLESKLKSTWISASERKHASTEYEEALTHTRGLAAEAFHAQLEHERQERRWAKIKALLLESLKETRGGFAGDETEHFLPQVHRLTSTTSCSPSATEEEQSKFGDLERCSMSLDDFWRLTKNHLHQWKSLKEVEHVQWRDFPWPTIKSLSTTDEVTYTTIEIYLFYPFCFKPYEIGLLRDHIWFLIATWHPDRFEDILSKVTEEDKTTVVQLYRTVMGTLYDVLTLSNSSLFKEAWWPTQYARIILGATIKREREVRQPHERIYAQMNGRGGGLEARSWGEPVEAEKVSESRASESDIGGSAPWQSREKKRRFEGLEEDNSREKNWKKVQRGDAGVSETLSNVHEGGGHPRRFIDTSMIAPIVERLEQAFEDVTEYKRLLLYRGPQAQMVLDLLQTLMNAPDLEPAFRRQLVVTMQRLSKKSLLYPKCFDLKDAVQAISEDPVAAGSFADIHQGRFQNQVVCIKLIRVYQSSQVEYIVKQFSREAILWGQLSHRNLLPFYGIYRYRNRLCLVSPWIEHGHIREYLERNSDVNRLHLALDVAAGVSYLHARDIIHGDLKGPNILVNSSGIACLADFGLSAITDPQILTWTSQSSPASKGGSLRWQAPELLENDEDVKNTKASDVYAWSCVCYEIFTGRAPFFNLSNPTTTLRIIQGVKPSCPPPTSPPRARWGLTKPIWLLMMECWAYDPATRPPITVVVNRLARQSIVPDLRPTQAWKSGNFSPARFRNAMNQSYHYPSVEQLDFILSV